MNYTHLANGILLLPIRSPQLHVVLLIFFLVGGGFKKTGAKFIIRDTAKQVGEHKDSLLRQKQGRDAHLEERVGTPTHLVKRSLGVSHLDTWFESRWWQRW